MIAAVATVAMALVAQSSGLSTLRLSVPSDFEAARLEHATVCRDERGGLRDPSPWRPFDAFGALVHAPAGARCRALVRPQGTRPYLATYEAIWRAGSGPLVLANEWLRTIEAPGEAAGMTWIGESGAPGPECTSTRAVVRCMFVPAPESGAIVVTGDRDVRFAISRAGDSSQAVWRGAQWGRMVRVHFRQGVPIDVAIHALSAAFRSGTGMLRQAHVSSAARVYQVGARLFLIEGLGTDGRVDIAAEGAATLRLPLLDIRGPSAIALDVALAPEETIEGEVRARGALLEGALVLLARLIDDPAVRRETEEARPLEFLAETTTNATGTFRFGRLAREKHELLVIHPTRGRARVLVTAPARPRVTVAPRALARGRVVIDGVPAEAAVVSVLPDFDAIAGARNPISLFSESTRTGRDGRFEAALPDEGHVSLTVSHEETATRIGLGKVDDLPPVIELGDIRLEAPIEVQVLAALEPGCVLQAAGPFGQPGMAIARAVPVAPGRWVLRVRLPGRWLFEASCGGTAVLLEPAITAIERGSRESLVLEIRRGRWPGPDPCYPLNNEPPEADAGRRCGRRGALHADGVFRRGRSRRGAPRGHR